MSSPNTAVLEYWVKDLCYKTFVSAKGGGYQMTRWVAKNKQWFQTFSCLLFVSAVQYCLYTIVFSAKLLQSCVVSFLFPIANWNICPFYGRKKMFFFSCFFNINWLIPLHGSSSSCVSSSCACKVSWKGKAERQLASLPTEIGSTPSHKVVEPENRRTLEEHTTVR